MAGKKITSHDKHWSEVEQINSYAIFMGCLLKGVRGLGLLVLTWTTVVLLGGFVSMLQKKDFWCLTAITLVQTAGVFDFLLKEKAIDVVYSLIGLLRAVFVAVTRAFNKNSNDKEPSAARMMLVVILFVVQVLVFALVLCPLAILYVLGLYLSAGISSWRLIQHNYGDTNGGANLKPALNVLYSLAMAQGVVYGYRTIYNLAARTGLVEHVAEIYSLETDLVSEYLEETVEGCMKDPSFARGRNLVTYAMDLLMESKSRYSYISGILILGRVVLKMGRHGVMKELLTQSAYFSHMVQRLVETFGPTSPYSTEIKVRAARIVATVAGNIRLDHFPAQGMMMIQCVSSLLDTFEEYSWRPEGYDERPRWYNLKAEVYERGWQLGDRELCYLSTHKIPRLKATDSKMQGYKGLVVEGLCILQGLAVDEDNCRVISRTHGLLSKAMAHLTSDRLHSDDHHDEWSSMAQESLELMKRLMATLAPPGEIEATKMPSEISGYIQAIISTLKGILECVRCQVLLKRQAVEVLLDLSVDTQTAASVMPSGRSSSTMFLWILLHVFLLPDYHFGSMCGSTHFAKKSSDIARLAGEKMQAMICPKTEESDTSMLTSVVGSLARTVAGAENSAYRIHAAMILEHLCQHYTKYDQNLEVLKKAVANVMEEVLKEIVHWLVTKEVVQDVPEANNGGCALLAEEGLDLERQGGVPHDNIGQEESSSTPHHQKGEQHQGIQLMEALVGLCSAISSKGANWHCATFTCQLNEITAKICSDPNKTFYTLVEEAKEKLRQEKKALQY